MGMIYADPQGVKRSFRGNQQMTMGNQQMTMVVAPRRGRPSNASRQAEEKEMVRDWRRECRATRLHPLGRLADRFLARWLDRGPQPEVVLFREAALHHIMPAELEEVLVRWKCVRVWIGGTPYWAYPDTPLGDLGAIAQGQEIALLPWTCPKMFPPWPSGAPALEPIPNGLVYTREPDEEHGPVRHPQWGPDFVVPPALDHPDDDELLRRYLAGGEHATDALGQLFARYYQAAYDEARHRLDNHHDIKEVVQDSFLKAQEGLKDFKGQSSFKTWLLAIVKNTARDRRKYGERRRGHRAISLDALPEELAPRQRQDGKARYSSVGAERRRQNDSRARVRPWAVESDKS
jgi:RNA polymerase sigma factor (sigma-70 family)